MTPLQAMASWEVGLRSRQDAGDYAGTPGVRSPPATETARHHCAAMYVPMTRSSPFGKGPVNRPKASAVSDRMKQIAPIAAARAPLERTACQVATAYHPMAISTA